MSSPPTKYTRNYNFNDYQTANPSTPLPGLQVDGELNELKDTTDAIIDRLAEIQRDDGPLKNASVGLDQLTADLVAYITALAGSGGGGGGGGGGSGVTDFKGRSGSVTPTLGDYTASLVTFTPAGGISASTVQSAIAELDTEKANASDLAGKSDTGHTHTPTEAGATTAGATLMTAANNSAQRTALGLGSAATLNVGVAANNIVQLDGSGKLPAIDGSQLTNLVVSANPTGTVMDYIGAAAPTGYVMLSGRTIGNAASGGTERANADTSALYSLLWSSMADAQAPVSGGRGASAAADFAANKTITLPDFRGRASVGKDNMGGSAANRVTVAGTGIDGTILGASGGAQTHTLSTPEIPSHTHSMTGKRVLDTNGANTLTGTGSLGQVINPSTDATGGGGAHNNMQPFVVLNKIIKL